MQTKLRCGRHCDAIDTTALLHIVVVVATHASVETALDSVETKRNGHIVCHAHDSTDIDHLSPALTDNHLHYPHLGETTGGTMEFRLAAQ